ncbi:MAG: tRNA pseudouridine(55) synthase TruB [Patescibacteria group bacterium]|nr:tRNA pseudouridine(55) synthase TruB [Patescibacteria group bacterium]
MNDILLIDKEVGWTSHDVVAYIRKQLTVNQPTLELRPAGSKQETKDQRSNFTKVSLDKQTTGSTRLRVGHAGTLDPFATGLLIILVGKEATKRQAEFLKLDKEYEATLELGKVSTTGDPEGIISSTVTSSPVASNKEPVILATEGRPESEILEKADSGQARMMIQRVLQSFIGEIEQTPHKFSAIKINGKKAYELARKGQKVDLEPRKVRILNIDLINYAWPYLKIKIACSSGTYIRSLAEDIGKALETGAYLTELRRTKIGDFQMQNAKKISDFCYSAR